MPGGNDPSFITRNVATERTGASAERQRLIDALAASSVVSNAASARVGPGKLPRCLDVNAFHEFIDEYQQLGCARDVVHRLIQVARLDRLQVHNYIPIPQIVDLFYG